jgi:hypothetical protein
MAMRGVHFALTQEQHAHLLSLKKDDDKIEYVQGTIEDAWDEGNLQETDKAWLPIHRCMTDDSDAKHKFAPDKGKLPLKLLIFGGRKVLKRESEFLFRLVEAEQLPKLVAALEKIDKKAFKAKFEKFCKNEVKDYGPEAFDYTWDWFEKLQAFVKRINGTGRSILFTVDI